MLGARSLLAGETFIVLEVWELLLWLDRMIK